MTDRRIEKLLILPFALVDERVRDHAGYLGRQLAIAIRNVYAEVAPGVVEVTPLVAETDGERAWVVHDTAVHDAEARRLAYTKGFPVVVRGHLSVSEEDAERLQLDVTVLRCSDGALLGRRRACGRLMDLVVSVSNLLARLGIADPEVVGEKARPATEDEEAFAGYLLGLDVLLALKTEGMSLPDPSRALDPFESALSRDPELRVALDAGLGAAVAVLDSGDEEASEAACHRLALWMLRFPDDLRIPILRTEILARIGRPEEALSVTRAALEGDATKSPVLWVRRSILEERLGHHRDALESLARAREFDATPELALRQSKLALAVGDIETARRELVELVEAHPTRRDWMMALVRVEHRAGYKAEAWGRLASLLHDDVAADPKELRSLLSLLEEGDVPTTLRDRLRGWRPRGALTAETRTLLGRALARSGATLEAKLCLRGIDPGELSAEDALTLARERLQLADPAFESRFLKLSTQIASGPEVEVTQEDLAFLGALAAAEPVFWPGRFLQALGLARAGRLEEALRVFDDVLDGQPSNDLAWFSRGLQLRKLGRLEEARESIQNAVQIREDERDYHAQLTVLAAELADAPAARRHFERARILRPDHPDNEVLRNLVDKLAS